MSLVLLHHSELVLLAVSMQLPIAQHLTKTAKDVFCSQIQPLGHLISTRLHVENSFLDSLSQYNDLGLPADNTDVNSSGYRPTLDPYPA